MRTVLYVLDVCLCPFSPLLIPFHPIPPIQSYSILLNTALLHSVWYQYFLYSMSKIEDQEQRGLSEAFGLVVRTYRALIIINVDCGIVILVFLVSTYDEVKRICKHNFMKIHPVVLKTSFSSRKWFSRTPSDKWCSVQMHVTKTHEYLSDISVTYFTNCIVCAFFSLLTFESSCYSDASRQIAIRSGRITVITRSFV